MATELASRWERSRGWVIGFLLGGILGAVVAGVVYVNGRERLVEADQAHATRIAEVNRAEADARAALDAARATEALLRARVAASVALDEANRANFGLARDQLRVVSSSLAQVDAVLAGVDPAALEAARTQVKTAMEEVSPDPETLRTRLFEVEQAVDRLLPRAPQG